MQQRALLVGIFVGIVTFLWSPAVAGQTPGLDEIDLLRGDANSNGWISSADSFYILIYLFSGGSSPSCRDAADVNDDGFISLSDCSYLNSYLYSGGAPPPAPYPFCGRDQTADALDCNESSCAGE